MPYIPHTLQDIEEMLKVVGLSSLEELYAQIPSSLRLKKPLDLARGSSEFDVKKRIEELAAKNITLDKYNSFLGAGCYDHYIPAALPYMLSQPQFLTAYTPYQAECSQGILQAIYEYQSYICLLTGMDVSNASMFDGASSLAEAVLMALRMTKRKKVLVAEYLHPEYKETLNTYLSGFDFTIQQVKVADKGILEKDVLERYLDDDVVCCCLQSPNFFGLVENVEQVSNTLASYGAITIMVTNPMSLAILKEPAELGVDIVCGDGQPLGGSLSFGGPSLGFLAARKKYTRQIPGRIVGKTTDKETKPAYCLTLQTREQHIRREKATSNICSNHSLNAIGAAVYLSLMGQQGMKNVALSSFQNTQYLYQRLKEIRGIKIPYSKQIFNEFIWEVQDAAAVIAKLYEKNIIAGYFVGGIFPKHKNAILSCCTEKKTKADIDNFIETLAEVLHGETTNI